MSGPTLNDFARFWLSVAAAPDIVDDPKGFSHPLADRAADLGISPGRLSDFCRHVHELRAKHAAKSDEQGGEGGGFDFQRVDTLPENFHLRHDHPLLVFGPDGIVRSYSLGVES